LRKSLNKQRTIKQNCSFTSVPLNPEIEWDPGKQKEVNMLNLLVLIAVIILIIWLLGLVLNFLSGPILWILLIIGIVFLIAWLVPRLRKH